MIKYSLEKDLKAVDELLAKAQMLISQASLGTSRAGTSLSSRRSMTPQTTTNSNEIRKLATKSQTDMMKLPSKPNPALNRPKTTKSNVPVFMNAPYKTDPLPTFRRSKSVSAQLVNKPSPKSNAISASSNTQNTENYQKYFYMIKFNSNRLIKVVY